jgi:cellulose synthase/poly-beta-1,6-N-acetylglucosamine synthase-like glycosyltransferase
VSVWQALNLLSGAALGATWLYHTMAARHGIPQIAELTLPEYAVPPGTRLPRVSIIVPARNEAAMIEAAVRSLLSIDYPDYELIIVDDRSEDTTGEILRRLESEYGARLVVVRVSELPPGWLGKTHAMWSAAREATGEWILFSDADVIHEPEALRRAVHYAEQEQADHMVLLPTMLMESVGERMMVSFFQAMFIFAYRPWKVRDPKARDSMGVGAFNMVRHSAYEKVGTYESMRLSVVDDMRLGERVKQVGLASRVAFGENMVQIRWAVGASGVVRNLTKNFFAQLHYSVAFALIATCGLLWLHLGPWIGSLFASGWARAGYAVALGSLLAVYVAMGRRTKIGTGYVLLHPVASVLMVFTLVLSTVVTLARGGVVWRGTFYPLGELKKNC